MGTSYRHSTANYGHVGTGYSSQPGSAHLTAQDVDAIQFKFASGNIESGEITMFGIVNS